MEFVKLILENSPKYHYQGEDGIFIYGLFDPDDETIRYIGATKNLENRLHSHCTKKNKHNKEMQEWIDKLKKEGKSPRMSKLGRVEIKIWESAERRWIGFCRQRGKIYNKAPGGHWHPKFGILTELKGLPPGAQNSPIKKKNINKKRKKKRKKKKGKINKFGIYSRS